ncbi:Spermidine/putrescine transport system permease PotC [Mycoplasma haemocanis str. Illinois]|uniref:Spermidine/putrescine transport system permease PotC n=1 Tax=Mycoplasma haemocanis (strain Illinois) TaxID=1111676 RepID=H6N8L9_MYCHN|nr:polyamine ABC transporter permease [Mycoplasma haemocanis]AEW45991.1 Spermidine/putrescine transport system permease PotC [Mycoplasma haemocanis str. Illinois]
MTNFLLNVSDPYKWKKGLQKFYVLFLLLSLYIPLISFILLSFVAPSNKGNVSTSFREWNGVHNYIKFFTDTGFSGGVMDSFINSLIIALIATPISLFIGLLTVVNLWKNFGKNKNYVFMVSNFSISCPDIVQGIAFSILFSVLILPFGFSLGMFTIILAHVAFSVPYVIIFLYPRLSKIHTNILFVSQDLNYGFFEFILEVLIPMLWPNLCAAALFIFSISFDDFVITNLVRGDVSTVTTDLYTMKGGIRAWSAVFGSLILIITTFAFLFSWLYKFRGC